MEKDTEESLESKALDDGALESASGGNSRTAVSTAKMEIECEACHHPYFVRADARFARCPRCTHWMKVQ